MALGDLAQHLDSLIDGEQAVFGDVDEDGDHHLVIEARGSADDVEMAVCDGSNEPGHATRGSM
jgi:hypothetical protein